MNTVHIVNRTNRTNTRLYEQTLSERSLTICERSCPTPHSGSRSGLGSRLPTAPPRTRPRLARRCALHARASRATVCRFEQVAGLQTDAKERVLRPLRDVLRRVALRLAGDQADERLDASGDEGEAEEDETVEIEDELKAYLELPQLKCKTEQEAIDWWVEK